LLPIDKHRPALNITLKYEQFNILSTTYDITYDFKNCDYVKIVKYIGDLLNSISSDVNGVVDRLFMILHNSINIFVPKRRIINNTYPIWYSNSLKLLLKEKKICHLVYKQFNNISDYITFSHLRAKCKRLAKSNYKNYINNVQFSIRNNLKYFWSFIKNVTNNNALPKSLSLDTTVVNNGTDIVNVFAKYFSNSYSNVQQPPNSSLLNINKINLNSDINLNSIAFTELDVLCSKDNKLFCSRKFYCLYHPPRSALRYRNFDRRAVPGLSRLLSYLNSHTVRIVASVFADA
jgi:hypothetical protein